MHPPGLLAVTMGEPAGIGGELTLKSWLQREIHAAPFFVIDSQSRLTRITEILNLPVPMKTINDPEQASDIFPDALPVLDVGQEIPFNPGTPDPKHSSAVCKSIELAVSFALGNRVSGVVTNPIQKKALYDAGFDFPGHTEFIAHLAGGQPPVMMLATDSLRVVPITIHQPLASAISGINRDDIINCTRIAANALVRDFGIDNPGIAIAGLNPHAGEEGTLGSEEKDIIEPAIQLLKDEGLDVTGPVPPDALFTPRARAGYDAAMCHYHDQALIPIKALAVDEAVNVTLGLPIVRTSPDHGTALDIAAKGEADPQSMICALKMARMIAANRALSESVENA